MSLSLHVISPSSSVAEALVEQRIRDLNTNGAFRINEGKRVLVPNPTGGPASLEHRLTELLGSLHHHDAPVLLAARGGYGASDLLPHLPWEELRKLPPRWLVGFSDISCLQSAFWTKLGWPSIHGPMLASPLWGLNSRDDVQQLIGLLQSRQGKKGVLRISPLGTLAKAASQPLSGWLFGGCFSVLTNLIGTPYFPSSLAGALVLLEDTGENQGRMLRFWNQWLQSGVLAGVRGVVLGRFVNGEPGTNERELRSELAVRCPVPCWSSEDFGHISPNFPFVIGARGQLSSGTQQLRWEL